MTGQVPGEPAEQTRTVPSDRRLIVLGTLWLVLIGLWLVPAIIDDGNRNIDSGPAPLWPRLAFWLLLAAGLLASVAWGRYLGRRQLREQARISFFAAALVTLIWCVVVEIYLHRLVEHAEDYLAGLFVIGFFLVVLTVLGFSSAGLAAGWASARRSSGRRPLN